VADAASRLAAAAYGKVSGTDAEDYLTERSVDVLFDAGNP
jgi:hypothetical protein